MAGIELRGLRKAYRTPSGLVRAVRGIDVAIAPAETVALLGPNGAGKSTTIDMLLGLQEPDEGTVSVFGVAPAHAISGGRIGAMLQNGGLLRDLTVRELVAMIASLYPRPLGVDETLELTRIGELGGRRTQKLSGGETQRVRFAIALVSNPDLLVLDEPTVGMDVEARHAFWTTVRDFARRGRTVVFAMHYLEEADTYADRAVLMARGRVVADGPTTEIKALVGSRTIRATLPDVLLEELERLPGVTRAERRGESVVLVCADSRTYFRVKVLTAYAMALVTIALLYIAGATLGVRLQAGHWVEMTLLMLVGLIPFAGLGILMGHLLTPDSIGPAMGGTTALLALLGGIWFPIGSGVMRDVAEALPSYWLVQASHVGIGGSGWGATGWAVVAAWSVAAALGAARAYRRDTQRV